MARFLAKVFDRIVEYRALPEQASEWAVWDMGFSRVVLIYTFTCTAGAGI